ncbi:MAG: SGNH/GDSL hydrolase family protein [Jaaginema sp. PMC 1079.18]|nr:SGNH/GDSL hydrolase family protein [Jaaginema sp. PMC 1080.18]MEC4851151.1 SGNH/GDSL hydrolase family protein [Jaaginema sp. PMC 1079.18]MEC4866706.1 SGNH/GDSL hydrolase family protein [Jaaginema sp. PMC 1078.18]
MKIPRRYQWLSAILLSFILLEAGLRLFLGLGYPVLSMADAQTGYRFQPNQNRHRLGKKQQYNQYSQRSEAVVMPKPDRTFRILMVGDSVLNGGTPTDQSQTISELLEGQLPATQKTVEVLNASAGSWGIGNQLGYLRKFGLFDSDILILQIGTHDLVQPQSQSDRVGHDPNYPDHLPFLATQELWQRYLWPRLQSRFWETTPSEIPTTEDLEQQFQKNMADLQEIINLAQERSVMVYVLYTPNWVDVLPQPSEPLYKNQFLDFLKGLHVPVIDIQQAWANEPSRTVETYFRDSVHLTVAGHKAIAEKVRSRLSNKL